MSSPQIDLRYAGDNEGELSVVVAPVLRFLDVGFNANVRIEVRHFTGSHYLSMQPTHPEALKLLPCAWYAAGSTEERCS